MKKALLGLCVFICSVVSCNANMLLYSFEGTINFIGNDGLRLLEDAGLDFGSTVEYQYLLDFDRLGERYLYGTTYDKEFYAEALPTYNVTFPGLSSLDFENFDSYDRMGSNYYWGAGYVDGGISTNVLQHDVGQLSLHIKDNVEVEKWEVGQIVHSYEYYRDLDDNYTHFGANVTITGIEQYYPVPEPDTMMLLGFGLLSFSWVGRQVKSKTT